MKIIYLDQYFNTPLMSGGTRSYEMAKRLIALGHDVCIITSCRDKGVATKKWFVTNESGIKVYWYPIPYSNKMGFYARIVAFLTYVFAATFLALKIKADVLLATSTPLTIAIPAIFVSKLKRLPMIFEVRDLWPEVPIALGILKNPVLVVLSKLLEKLAYYFADEVIALAPGMKEAILKINKQSSVAVIPNGCDFDLFDVPIDSKLLDEKFAWLKGKKVVMYPGTIGRVNNVEYLVPIARAMLEISPNIVFVVVGDGIMADLVRKDAIEHGVLNRNFFLIGEVTKAEIVEWFKISSIIAVFYKAPLCATQNSVQNKFFDALSAGKPVVFDHDGWSVNMLEAAGGAFRIPDSDSNKSAEIIAAYLNNESWYKNACLISKDLGKKSFNRDEQAKDLDKILHKSLKN